MIRYICPGCRRTLTVGDEFVGQQADCPLCGAAATIPWPVAARAEPPPRPARRRRLPAAGILLAVAGALAVAYSVLALVAVYWIGAGGQYDDLPALRDSLVRGGQIEAVAAAIVGLLLLGLAALLRR